MEHIWDEGGTNENSRGRGEDRFEMSYVQICYKIGAALIGKGELLMFVVCFVCLFVLNRNC